MGYFPFYIDITGKKCIVIGGGKVAFRKIEKLIEFGPEITVISPEICDEITRIETVKKVQREFFDSDIEGAFFVITATDDRKLNKRVYELCSERKIPVNSVDDIENCSFIFPSLVHVGDVTIGISTGGTSPTFAKIMRRVIEDELDDSYINMAEVLKKYRPIIKEMFDTEEKRKEANEAVVDECLISDNLLPEDDEIMHLLELIRDCRN